MPLPGEVDGFAAQRKAGAGHQASEQTEEEASPPAADGEPGPPVEGGEKSPGVAATPVEDLDAPDAESPSLDTAQGRERAVEVFEAYLSLPDWDRGPLAVELSEAGGALATKMGAPVFGGHILAAAVTQIEQGADAKALPEHLLITAETYLAGRDFVRAQLIAEFAQTRLSKAALASPRWKNVLQRLAGEADAPVEKPLTPEDAERIDKELAASEEALKKAVEAHHLAEALVAADLKDKPKDAAKGKRP
jgi:hypothetical protein